MPLTQRGTSIKRNCHCCALEGFRGDSGFAHETGGIALSSGQWEQASGEACQTFVQQVL